MPPLPEALSAVSRIGLPENRRFDQAALSENSKPFAKKENESGKSSELSALFCPIPTHLKYSQLAKPCAVEFSDTPKQGIDPRSVTPYIANRRVSLVAILPLAKIQKMGALHCGNISPCGGT